MANPALNVSGFGLLTRSQICNNADEVITLPMPSGGTKRSAKPAKSRTSKSGSGPRVKAQPARAAARPKSVRKPVPVKRQSAAVKAVPTVAKSASKRAPTNPAVSRDASRKPPYARMRWFGLDYLTVLILLGGLALAAINLLIIIKSTGRVGGLEQAQNQLLANYSRSVERQSELYAFQQKLQETPPPVSEPAVLWSVVAFADEQEKLAIIANLVQPLLAWHTAVGSRPEALLIERRFADSENVSLRLFLADDSEQAFLWPETGTAADTQWLPPCGPNSPEGLERPVACPTQFLLDFPHITETLLKMSAN